MTGRTLLHRSHIARRLALVVCLTVALLALGGFLGLASSHEPARAAQFGSSDGTFSETDSDETEAHGRAEGIEHDDAGDADGESEEEDEWHGLVVSRPENGLGSWVIRTGADATRTALADASTRFDAAIPTPGEWVEIEGTAGPDNLFLATRIRVDEFEAGEVVLRLESGVLSGTVAARHGLTPLSTLLASGNIYLFQTEEDEGSLISELERDPDVHWAELNFVSSVPEGKPYKTWRWGGVDPTEYSDQSILAKIGLDDAHATVDGSGVIVAVLDTGVDLQHWELTGRLIKGLDAIDDDAIAQDEGPGLAWGHGTHVAGIIARAAPGAQILPVRVLDANGRGNTFLLAYAIEWAVKQGADVINLSLGSDHDSRILREAIDAAVKAGVVVVAAAGNNGNDVRQYPAAYPGVLGVTAVDGSGLKADFANFGGDWVDIAAPGVGVISTMIGATGSGYAQWSGTSMSTAFVSGAAALVDEAIVETQAQAIARQLIDSAADLDALNPAHAGQLGGLLDAAAAVSVKGETAQEGSGLGTSLISSPTSSNSSVFLRHATEYRTGEIP